MEKGKMLKYLLVLFLTVVVSIAFLMPSTLATDKEYILKVPTDCPPSTFNPLQASRDICQSVWISGLLYEPLMLDLFNGTLVPWLAKSWEILDNGTRYVFHLDERAKWSDGVPVTARDVEVSWNLTRTYAATALLEGILVDVRAVDNHTVEFITTKPWSRWMDDFGGSVVLPAHIWEKLKDPLSYDFIDNPSAHVTSGAFIYDSYTPGQWWLFRKRADYWKTESIPKIDKILIRFVADFSMYPPMLLKGEVDIAEIPFYLLPQVIGKPNINVWINPVQKAQEIVFINTRIYPLNLVEVRRAVELAIDKVEIAQFYFQGYGYPANKTLWDMKAYPDLYVPEAVWPGFGKTHEECVAEANRILDNLGFTRGPDGIRVTPNGTRLSFKYIVEMAPMTQVRLRVADAITSYLKEIGIEVSQFVPLMIPETFGAVFFAEKKDWGFAEFTDGEPPSQFYDIIWWLQPPSGINYLLATGWHETEPEYAERVNNLSRIVLESMDYNRRVEALKEIIKIQAERLPLICVTFYSMWIWAYRTDTFTNWNFDAVTKWMAGGFHIPWRPLAVQELTPVGWQPTPTPTTTPTPAGLTTEQIIIIAVVIIVIIAIVGYLAYKRKTKT